MSHFYDYNGNAVFEVPNASSGGMRPTTIKDARKLGLLPSVSTIFEVLAKPELDDWKARQVTCAAFMTQPKPMETLEAYHSRIMQEADKPRDNAADLGTRIHKAIEQFFAGEAYDSTLKHYVDTVDSWRKERNIEFVEHELRLVNSSVGYAGTTDIVYSSGTQFGILDFKTRKTKPGKPCTPYSTQPAQIGAYSMAKWGEIADLNIGGNVYLSVNEPGRIEVVWYNAEKLKCDYDAFLHMHALWCWTKNYRPVRQ